jgi:hypothetical protein
MEFTLYIKDNPYPEYYKVPECKTPEDCERYARKIIAKFNATLRPGEHPREFERIVAESNTATVPHSWVKTNVATITGGSGRAHDTYRCERCGVSGKRFGLEQLIQIDQRYHSKKYLTCTTKPIK